VQGTHAQVDAKGNFRVHLKGLRDGKVPLKVKARSVSGLRQEAEQEVRIDTHGPKSQVEPPPWVNEH